MTTRVNSGHGTLAQRTTGRRPATPLPTHVVVTHGGQEHPGILLEWLGGGTDWSGRVVWAHSDGSVHVSVLTSRAIRPLMQE